MQVEDALAVASRLLARRELTRQGLTAELARRGVPLTVREEAVARLVAAGAVDDERAASSRADVLVRRGYGNAFIRADLMAKGVDRESADAAIGELEAERDRAETLVAAHGAGPRTARYLARKGFGEEAIESALAGHVAQET